MRGLRTRAIGDSADDVGEGCLKEKSRGFQAKFVAARALGRGGSTIGCLHCLLLEIKK